MSYTPQPYTGTDEVSDLRRYVLDELRRISMHTQVIYNLPTTKVEPERASAGDIIYVDGAGFDPGAGEGFYGYVSTGGGSWNKLSL